MEEQAVPRVPTESVTQSFINEKFQVRLWFNSITSLWYSHIHSVVDNKTCQLSHLNLGKLLTDVRQSILKKDVELSTRNGKH